MEINVHKQTYKYFSFIDGDVIYLLALFYHYCVWFLLQKLFYIVYILALKCKRDR